MHDETNPGEANTDANKDERGPGITSASEASPSEDISVTALASGNCLCGAVRFTTPARALWCAHCHCTRCQRAHGAAFVTWVGTRAADSHILDPSLSLRWFESDAADAGGERGFCGFCGSPMFFRSERWPGELHIARALFNTPVEPAPQLHAYFDTHVAWVELGDKLPGRPSTKVTRRSTARPGRNGPG